MESIHLKSIRRHHNRRPWLWLLFCALALGGIYAWLCYELGNRFVSEVVKEASHLGQRQEWDVLSIKKNQGWFRSTIKVEARLKDRYRAHVLSLRIYGSHTPIPFGRGWGRLVTSDISARLAPEGLDLNADDNRAMRSLGRQITFFDRSTELYGRIFPFMWQSHSGSIALTERSSYKLASDRSGSIRSLMWRAGRIEWQDRWRQGSIANLEFTSLSREDDHRLRFSHRLDFSELNLAEQNSNRRSKGPQVHLKDGQLLLSLKNVAKIPARRFMETLPWTSWLLGSESSQDNFSPLYALLKESPGMKLSVNGQAKEQGDQEVKVAFDMNFPRDPSRPGFVPFENAELSLNLVLPSEFVETSIASQDAKRALGKLVQSGILQRQRGHYITEIRYEKSRMFLNGRISNKRLMNLLR